MPQTHHAPGTFCWFECATSDAAAATTFFKEIFSWDSAQVPMPGIDTANYTLLRLGGDDVGGLYQLPPDQTQKAHPHWLTYVTVEDVDACCERALTLGGKVLAPAMDVPGVGRLATLQDPTGARFAISRPGEHPGRANLGMAFGSFGWSELATRDTGSAIAFYSKLFSWRMKGDSSSTPYTEVMVGEEPIGGIMEMSASHGKTPPFWLPYVMVEDTDAIAGRVGELNGRLYVPPTSIPHVGRFAVFSEPGGSVLAVIRLETHPS